MDGQALTLADGVAGPAADALIGLAADALGVGRFAASARALERAAGLVADSDPATEYEETRNKAMAMLRSLGYERPQDREEAV